MPRKSLSISNNTIFVSRGSCGSPNRSSSLRRNLLPRTSLQNPAPCSNGSWWQQREAFFDDRSKSIQIGYIFLYKWSDRHLFKTPFLFILGYVSEKWARSLLITKKHLVFISWELIASSFLLPIIILSMILLIKYVWFKQTKYLWLFLLARNEK